MDQSARARFAIIFDGLPAADVDLAGRDAATDLGTLAVGEACGVTTLAAQPVLAPENTTRLRVANLIRKSATARDRAGLL